MMTEMRYSIDESHGFLTKAGEEICGDTLNILRNDDGLVAVLADGMGSGITASILSTLTGKIISTMISRGESMESAIETVTETLPISPKRGIAYSTFTLLQVSQTGCLHTVQFDNPDVILLRRGRIVELDMQERYIAGKAVRSGSVELKDRDMILAFSDGAAYAGLSATLPWGWQRSGIATYLKSIYKPGISAQRITELILSVCRSLYGNKPGDDVTVLTVNVKKDSDRNADGGYHI